MCLYLINLCLLVAFVHQWGSRSDVFFFAVAPTAAPLPHNARGRAERLQIRSYVLHGTALDIKQEGAGLKRRHVEQICRDQ